MNKIFNCVLCGGCTTESLCEKCSSDLNIKERLIQRLQYLKHEQQILDRKLTQILEVLEKLN